MDWNERLDQLRRFFGKRIWLVSQGELRRSRAVLYRMARIVYATGQAFLEKRLTFRAAALTYYTVLSIVPFLAFAFSVVKGFGGYQRLMEGTVRPYLQSTFGGNPSLLQALEQMLVFVDRTGAAGLNIVSVLVLGYTSISMLSTIESTLNEIWGAKSARPLLRQVTDYTTLLVITPLLVMVAAGFGAAAQSSGIVRFLTHTLNLGVLIDLALKVASLVLVCIAMICIYLIMPNVHVRLWSAVFGGLTAGLLWQTALFLHVKFQVGVANYNALYAGFGAVPIFLVWLYISWTIVLLGALLAASHQYESKMSQAVRARHVDQELRESLAIAVTAEVTRRFLRSCPPRTQGELAELLQVPTPTLEEVLDQLVKSGILIRAVCGHELGYMPARDVDDVRLYDVRDALRRDPEAQELKGALEQTITPSLRDLLAMSQLVSRKGPWELTLRELADRALPTHTPPQPHAVDPKTVDVLDAKQPDVPG